jgi:hypothetical protein
LSDAAKTSAEKDLTDREDSDGCDQFPVIGLQELIEDCLRVALLLYGFRHD